MGRDESFKMFVVFWKQREVKMCSRAGGCMLVIVSTVLSLFVCCGAAAVPHQDAVGQDTFNGAVIGHQQMLRQVELPEGSQEVQSLLCHPDQTVCVVCPWEVL